MVRILPSFSLGQLLKVQKGTYTIAKQLQETVWLAKNQDQQPVIVKSANHFRIENERDVLKRFQSRTPFLRPLVDEISEPSEPPTIVLKHLDDNLLDVAALKTPLRSQEVKYVAKGILEALKVLHEEGFVHTDIKPDNVFVNYKSKDNITDSDEDIRFTDVQLGDCGNTVPADSNYAKDCDMIGAPIWRSPEAQLQIGWGMPTDIWSFGAILITLIYGDNFFMFKPDVPADHNEYELRILRRQCLFFGPFPESYQEIADKESLAILMYIMSNISAAERKPFERISEREISKEDKIFLLKIMKLDPRDRPTAKQLLEDKWFNL
ncbi:serine/threonine protein kinase [Nannizzia gypsea CBS 118893]|uniref:Serine/threonine protein kinase n=1 Tax=Arthroderma gypseum (strain ATCC MYA-4604 / CBS 118893) TaxID=535722 RepID=E5R246_ARTGP|nr:serine/threonine protein kinase [Nannizzia gypsea CBS 118893]EFQ98610.1 serine/threonine protein kinase [Nannizzia gypsea CBS 118893]